MKTREETHLTQAAWDRPGLGLEFLYRRGSEAAIKTKGQGSWTGTSSILGSVSVFHIKDGKVDGNVALPLSLEPAAVRSQVWKPFPQTMLNNTRPQILVVVS